MTTSAVAQEEIQLPDGRVTLADPAHAGDPRFTNGDLAPLPIERPTWNTYNYCALPTSPGSAAASASRRSARCSGCRPR